jgi:flavin reductase (DIM6/NTAB) family NADH-FMN oxidoreductase RutF
MGHKHRYGTVDRFAVVRAERERPWSLVVDLLLLAGVLAWIALRVVDAYDQELFVIYSALLLGAIVHRIFTLMDRPGS